MKLRTVDEFEDAVARERAWRRRELTTLLFDAQGERPKLLPLRLRAGVTLLYAHWEGLIKAIAQYYLEFVLQRRMNYDELCDPLLATALKSRLNAFQQAKTISVHLDFVRFLRSEMATQATMNTAVQTEANLNSTVLREVVTRLGIPYSRYELNEKLIDERLLRSRNEIAHGEFLNIELAEFETLHREITSMLDAFTADVLNAAAQAEYRA